MSAHSLYIYLSWLMREKGKAGNKDARVACIGERRRDYEKQLHPKPLCLCLQHALQRKASKGTILSSAHAW